MRVVLDTSVVVAALRSSAGASRRLLRAALLGELELVVSNALLYEYEAVCTRQEHLSVMRLSPQQVAIVVDQIARIAHWAPRWWLWRPSLPDSDDEMVLEAAINGGAGVLVTFNPADFIRGVEQLNLEIMSPMEALHYLGLSHESPASKN